MSTKAYFENIQSVIATELEMADNSIYVAVAWFTDRQLKDILCQKASEGVQVRVLILNDDINAIYGINPDEIRAAGGEMHLIGSKSETMHNKFCVIDSQTVITGSYNWTKNAKTNDENITLTKGDVLLAADFIQEFNRLKQKYLGTAPDSLPDAALLIKRMQLLKSTIDLQDAEEISYQMGKLRQVMGNGQIMFGSETSLVLNLLDAKRYGEAARLLEQTLQKASSLTLWSDPEISGLKLEIHALGLQAISLENERQEISQTIFFFELQYRQLLGGLIEEILRLKELIASQAAKDAPQSEQKQQNYQEAKNDYEHFREEQKKANNTPKKPKLSQSEEKEIKDLYRKITKLTHPDMVAVEFEKSAEAIFIQATKAKESYDLDALQAILANLESGNAFEMKYQALHEREKLLSEATQLRQRVKDLLHAIIMLKASDSWQVLQTHTDLDAYFEQFKKQLSDELAQLKAQNKGK
jgi:hypothetical protein